MTYAINLLSTLDKEIKAASALEKKAEGARQTGKADKSRLLATSTYYRPLDLLLN
jgi:hypothetical protein